MVTHESGVFRPLGTQPVSIMHFAMQVMRWWSLDESVPQVVHAEEVLVPPFYPDTPVVRADIARHYNNIAYMDREVGVILRQLEEDGLVDSTIVIWTTDHGDGLPRAKRELYDSGIKVPMIIRWPEAFRPVGVKPGTIDERLISFVDLGPTILSLAGVPVPAYMHGQEFSQEDMIPRQYIYAARDRIDEVMDRQRAVRDKRYKYIRSWYPQQPGGHDLEYRNNIDMARETKGMYESGVLNNLQRQWYEPPGEERLFDLEQDPFELEDVSDAAAYSSVLSRMRKQMDLWLAQVGDWSEEPESEMVTRFQLDAERRITPGPMITMTDDKLVIIPVSAGHSLEYRLKGGNWQLYREPIAVPKGNTIEARAIRYGWKESETISGP